MKEPFHVQKIQLLADHDYPLCVELVLRMLDATKNDSQFSATVLFPVHAYFTQKDWSTQSKRTFGRLKTLREVLHKFSIKISS